MDSCTNRGFGLDLKRLIHECRGWVFFIEQAEINDEDTISKHVPFTVSL